MYTQEMLIGIGIACVLGGIILGLVAGRFLLRSKHAATLERELGEAQAAMKEYKNEVFQQFGDTARKFDKLNESYADLHQQLATSASVLCADMPDMPLLASSTVPALQANENTNTTTADEHPATTETPNDQDSVQDAAADTVVPLDVEADVEAEAEIETAVQAEIAKPTAEAVNNKPATP